ncbi:hypothetical protein SRHO_G00087560 [Serrasalmus rhombeus]
MSPSDSTTAPPISLPPLTFDLCPGFSRPALPLSTELPRERGEICPLCGVARLMTGPSSTPLTNSVPKATGPVEGPVIRIEPSSPLHSSHNSHNSHNEGGTGAARSAPAREEQHGSQAYSEVTRWKHGDEDLMISSYCGY